MVVVHTLKLSSLAHFLQIHCIGLAGQRFHASWAWPEKRDSTIGAVCGKSWSVSKCNDQSWQGRAPATRSPSEKPFWRWYKLHESPSLVSQNTSSLSSLSLHSGPDFEALITWEGLLSETWS